MLSLAYMDFIYPFQKLTHKDAALAGGKGASLGELTRAGFPVPPGFVISEEAFDSFLAQTDLLQEVQAQLQNVNHLNIASVERASEAIRHMMTHAAMPDSIGLQVLKAFDELETDIVAVRSSATSEDGSEASWAGELDTFLNIDKDGLLKHVQRCWASLFTPRAIYYRFEKGFAESTLSVAVVVQKMVRSVLAGAAFSVHPVTQDPHQMIIEAVTGYGERLASGAVTPDSYVLDKRSWKILDANHVDALQTLTDAQVIALAQIVDRIEKHYGKPVDVEWAMEGGKFYILQSRPITTLK